MPNPFPFRVLLALFGELVLLNSIRMILIKVIDMKNVCWKIKKRYIFLSYASPKRRNHFLSNYFNLVIVIFLQRLEIGINFKS